MLRHSWSDGRKLRERKLYRMCDVSLINEHGDKDGAIFASVDCLFIIWKSLYSVT